MLLRRRTILEFVLRNKRLLARSFRCPRYGSPEFRGAPSGAHRECGPVPAVVGRWQFSTRVQDIKHEVSDRRFPQHFVADFLSSESVLKSGKWRARPISSPFTSANLLNLASSTIVSSLPVGPGTPRRRSLHPESTSSGRTTSAGGSSGNDSVISSRVRGKRSGLRPAIHAPALECRHIYLPRPHRRNSSGPRPPIRWAGQHKSNGMEEPDLRLRPARASDGQL